MVKSCQVEMVNWSLTAFDLAGPIQYLTLIDALNLSYTIYTSLPNAMNDLVSKTIALVDTF